MLDEKKYYIIEEKIVMVSIPNIYKVLVLEVTNETYYLHNLDSNVKFRIKKQVFENKYKVVEEIGFNYKDDKNKFDKEFEKITDNLDKLFGKTFDNLNKTFDKTFDNLNKTFDKTFDNFKK